MHISNFNVGKVRIFVGHYAACHLQTNVGGSCTQRRSSSFYLTTLIPFDICLLQTLFIRIQRLLILYFTDIPGPVKRENIIFPPRPASGCTLHISEVSVSNADNRYGAVIGADQCQVAAPSAGYSIYTLYTATHWQICSRI